MKKLILFLAAISFSCALWAQSGKTGKLKWELENETLTISGYGAMPNYDYKGSFLNISGKKAPWTNDKYIERIKSVVIKGGVTNIGEWAFYDCKNIVSISIPSSVTNIESFAFHSCRGLTSVVIPESVTGIESYAFSYCSSLTSIAIPQNVTYIKGRVFSGCSNLTSITIPSRVISIDWSAFDNCKKIQDIYVNWQIPSNTFGRDIPTLATLHVPAGTKSLYQQVEGWKRFENIVEQHTNPNLVNTNEGRTTIQNTISIKKEENINNLPGITQERVLSSKRYALIIGNANYKIKPLNNPVNDAIDVAQKLKQLDFTVALVTDANLKEMKRAINDIVDKAKGYDVIMFYYSGHGIQHVSDNKHQHENWLPPVDAEIKSPADLEQYCVNLNWILRKMGDAECQTKIVILDACRDNPFKFKGETKGSDDAYRGLTVVKASTGTFIAYAAEPGDVAYDGKTGDRNSPYTKALLKFFDEKLSIEQFFKKVRIDVRKETGEMQIPWESSSLIVDFYFNIK